MDQPYSLPPEVQAALDKGRLVEAIKLLRNSGSGLDLKGAKEAIEEHMRARRAGTATAPAPSMSSTPQQVAARDFGAVKNGDFTGAVGGLSPGQVSGGGNAAWWIFAIVVAFVVGVFVSGCASGPAAPVSQVAPSGKLRAAINFGNPILANRDPAGQPVGVSVDLANELGRRLGVPVELVTFNAAGRVVEALKNAEVDIGFVAIDPVRGGDILQTPAYVIIEGAYLVRNESPIRRNEEVDRPGVRVAVGNASAYDLYLTRELKNAKLVKAPTSPAVTDLFIAQNLEVAAGVKQQLQADAKRIPGLRLLDGRFMVIQQAMGLPKGRDAGAAYVTRFVEEMKASGFVAAALARHRIEGAAVAPPAI